jgi:arginine decarboxylase
MEGYDRIARACSIARWIRSELAEGHCRILSEEDLCSGIDRREAMLDPLKLTLYCGGQHGSFVREQRLFKERGIQVNKFSHNTVLLLVTIATTWSMADYLIRAIRDISTQTLQIHGGDLNLRLPCFSGFHPAFLNHSECSVSGPGDLAKAFDALVRDVRDPMLLDLAGPDPTIVPQGAVSVTYVTPYPPGYPVLVPGQLIDGNCVSFLCELMRGGMKTIHGLVHSKSGGCCLPYALLSEDTVL